MADDPSKGGSPKTDPNQVEASEDAETRAARRELKQSSLSDVARPAGEAASDTEPDRAGDLPTTPPLEADAEDQTKEGVLSPKKKRPHDQLDKDQVADDNDATSTTSTDSAKDRASRLEPEKKRHRDGETTGDESTPAAGTSESTANPSSNTSDATQPKTASSSAFAASGFGKLAAGASPFASLASPSKNAGFASAKSPETAQPAAAPKLTFGGGSSASPFAGLASKPSNGFATSFGSTAGSFGSVLGGGGLKPLSSFAAPGSQPLKSEKRAKPFGAPDSDVDEDEEEDGDDDGEGGDDASQPDVERLASPEKEPEEKKRLKLQRVEVNDGEAGEATIVSVRAKVFHHDKEVGWKERGAGMLKINVPEACLDFDALGVPIPGSFDASALEADDDDVESGNSGSKVARLILRQDQTHRVILNTAIVPAMKFQEKASLKSVGILFTAFEGEDGKPTNITVKLTAANAKTFMNEIETVQRELRDR